MRSLTAGGAAAVILSTLLVAPPPAAGAAYRPPTAQRDWVTPSHVVAPVKPGVAGTPARRGPGAPVWPAAGVAEVALAAARDRPMGVDEALPVGGMPLSVASAVGMRAAVRMYDRPSTAAAGVKGILFSLRRTDGGATGPVRVTIDYRAFAGAYGADWSNRLRLVRLPACALTTPGRADCRGTVLPGINDAGANTLSATVEVSTSDTMLALDAGPSGGAGDFGASSLQPSATWTAGSSTGEFTWNYQLRTPPALNGPAPKLALDYSSASVDGRMAASNNQPSWIGEGFEMWPGYIERRYQVCAGDMVNGNNSALSTGDQCWVTDNATLSLAGHAGELLKDATTAERWHLRADDGTYVQHRTGAGNGDDNGEWWVVTTTDGTQYWFGGAPSSNSTWTVPVAGNHTGEPCHGSTFDSSFCTQAWRWNLDHVVDKFGNTMTYRYTKETNVYAKAGVVNTPVSYDRGGYLTRIEYGTRTGSTGAAPMVVEFGTAERCLTASCGTHTAANWPDTPFDLECTGSPCYVISPTFWSTRRLVKVTTKLWTGSTDVYTPVTTWAFTHSFPDPGDGTRAGLVLNRIAQTGHVRVTTTVPDVTFAYVQKNNRVDPNTPDHSPPMNWFRLAQVTSEAGGRTEITYADQDCVPGTRMPNVNALEANTLRCYPLRWTPPGASTPVWDFFHRYVVAEVHEVDTVTPGNPTKVIQYEYVGDPAWHYTDDDGLVKAENKTWSVWRGYGAVRTREGVGTQTLTETRYFRGMHGDKLPSGSRTVSLTAVDMNADGDTTDPVDVAATVDEDAFAGMTRQSIVYNGTLSAEISSDVSVPWQSAATATRTINNATVYARHTAVHEEHARVIRDGGRAPRTTATITEFDDFGLPTEILDKGDEALSTDDTCSLIEYARNTAPGTGEEWLVNPVKRRREFAVGCERAKQPGLTADDVMADRKSYYDLAASVDTPPTRGVVTRTDDLERWESGAPVHMAGSTSEYDAYGRVVRSTDVKGNVTVTTYVHNAGGQLIRKEMTNGRDWRTSTDFEPAFGLPLAETDPNGRVTSAEYDGMGRVTAVWRPGRDKGVQTPSETYGYDVHNNAPSTITTSKLLPSGGYVTTYELFDGLLRPRQTQSPRGDGSAGTLVTDTFYDAGGRDWKTYSPYLVSSAPGPLLVVPNQEGDVPQRRESTFDGAGRPLATIRYVRNPVSGVVAEHSREVNGYGGDRVDTTPPTGGTATSTFTNSRGNVTARWQYHGGTATPGTAGSYDATTYEYTAKDQLRKVTDAAGHEWINKYDLRGQLVESTDPNTGTVTMTHNRYGELESTRDARGVVLVYTYDSLGRKTGLYQGSVSAATKRAEWFYDELVNSRGQLTRSVRWEGTNAYTREVLGFTATYQPSGVKYTVPAAEAGLNGSYSYFHTYYPDGSPETVQLPDIDGTGGMTSEVLRYEYNSLGKLNKMKTSLDAGTTYINGMTYTGYGEPATMTLQHNSGSTVTVARTYAEGTRLLTRLLTSRQTAPTSMMDLNYGYDTAGNPQKISDAVSGDHQCFDYDQLRRLTQAWTPENGDCTATPTVAALGGPAKYWTTWEFDASGNRKKQVEYVTPTGVKTTTYHHPDEPNRLKSATVEDSTGTVTRTWEYEPGGYVRSRPDGAVNQAISWDPEGRAAAVAGTTFSYDPDGARIVRRDSTGKALYLPGQELRYTAATGARKTIRFYSNSNEMVAMRTTGGVTWLAGDHQGTAGVTVTATTQAFAIRRQDPYGNPRTGTGTWPSTMDKGFVGGTKDSTGLTHLGAREYDPVVGRFLSPDPVVDVDNPQHLDSYAYGFQNPVTYADPGGEKPYEESSGDPYHKEYYLLDTIVKRVVRDGYVYTIRIALYIACRKFGYECMASYSLNGQGYTEWVGLVWILRSPKHYRLKIYADTSVTRTRVQPARGPNPPQRPEVVLAGKLKPADRCLPLPEKPSDNPCDYVGSECTEMDRWWTQNKDFVQGVTIIGGLVTCAFTAGLGCAIAGDAGLAVGVAGRSLDMFKAAHERGEPAPTWRDGVKAGAGVLIDYAGYKIPAIRNKETGHVDFEVGLPGQLTWAGVTWPATPWSDLTDPFKWTWTS